MFMKKTVMTIVLGFGLLAACSAHAADVLYDQPFDGTGNNYGSQNDTTGGFGNFATVYDNFTLAGGGAIGGVSWVGDYFNPPTQGPITAFSINFYADNGGQTGGVLQSYGFNGTANEVFHPSSGGASAYYTYEENLLTPFVAVAGTQYWLSIEPDLGPPPQWGWATGLSGDGQSYQDFFGTRGQLPADMAFTLSGSSVPDQGPYGLLFAGLDASLAVWHRKQEAA
jgi:hypothetical protein